jgi:hypothetical protein
MLPPMMHLLDDSDMDDELFMAMASAPWSSPPCCRWRNLPGNTTPSIVVAQLDSDEDSDLNRTRL